MFMYLRKNKKGFTLIELMVVVAIIGVLALLGLRMYAGQQTKAKEAIVKGNAGTIQTLIQSELADKGPTEVNNMLDTIFADSGIQNPFTNKPQTENVDAAARGAIIVDLGTGLVTDQGEGLNDVAKEGVFFVNGYGDDETFIYKPSLTAR